MPAALLVAGLRVHVDPDGLVAIRNPGFHQDSLPAGPPKPTSAWTFSGVTPASKVFQRELALSKRHQNDLTLDQLHVHHGAFGELRFDRDRFGDPDCQAVA